MVDKELCVGRDVLWSLEPGKIERHSQADFFAAGKLSR